MNIVAAFGRDFPPDFTQPFQPVIVLFIHKDFPKVPTG
jgi:hypothetical protein